MSISIIVAVSENGVIGKDNQLLWHLGSDLKRFKALTTGHTVVMGRNTFLSIGRALPNRRNVVLSSSMKNGEIAQLEIFPSMDEFLKTVGKEEEVFIIGGGQIYHQFLSLATRVYLTRVHTQVEGDTFFADLNPNEWVEIAKEELKSDEKNDYDFDFIDYHRCKE